MLLLFRCFFRKLGIYFCVNVCTVFSSFFSYRYLTHFSRIPFSIFFSVFLPLQLRLAADDALSDRIIHEVGLRESDTRKLTSMIIEREREIAALGALNRDRGCNQLLRCKSEFNDKSFGIQSFGCHHCHKTMDHLD
jgi:hypothetical protein